MYSIVAIRCECNWEGIIQYLSQGPSLLKKDFALERKELIRVMHLKKVMNVVNKLCLI
jgi:hypothetical protein